MEAVIFCGIQAAGKSSFYRERFFRTHVRISLDLLRTRHRERLFLNTCLESGQRFVVDNTNPTRAERAMYIAAAKAKGFSVIGYHFSSPLEDALRRNAAREGVERVPDVALRATLAKFERPLFGEGFDSLYEVRLSPEGFHVRERHHMEEDHEF